MSFNTFSFSNNNKIANLTKIFLFLKNSWTFYKKHFDGALKTMSLTRKKDRLTKRRFVYWASPEHKWVLSKDDPLKQDRLISISVEKIQKLFQKGHTKLPNYNSNLFLYKSNDETKTGFAIAARLLQNVFVPTNDVIKSFAHENMIALKTIVPFISMYNSERRLKS